MKKISRRRLLHYSALLTAVAATTPIRAAIPPSAGSDMKFSNATFYVPGYRPRRMLYQGIPLSHHPKFTEGINKNYQGPRTMVSQFKWDGKVRRKVFPLKGHQITVSKHSSIAFYNSIDHPTMASFDRESLQLDRLIYPHSKKFVGGGHALFTDDGTCLINLERKNFRPFQGNIKNHYGAIVIRDSSSMKVLTVYSCYGINPHEIRMVDKNTVAVSNYGSTDWPLDRQQQAYPFVVEPSITLVNIRDGALVNKFVCPNKELELRHLAVDKRGGIVAIQTRLMEAKEERSYSKHNSQVYEADDTVNYKLWFGPAPLLSVSGRKVDSISLPEPMDQRQGQSILYDPQYDQFIVTYTSSHRIAIVDAENFTVKHVIKTDECGIFYPRGIQLLPDNIHYAVSGSWRNIKIFKRGTHQSTESEQSIRYETFSGHSHMSVI